MTTKKKTYHPKDELMSVAEVTEMVKAFRAKSCQGASYGAGGKEEWHLDYAAMSKELESKKQEAEEKE